MDMIQSKIKKNTCGYDATFLKEIELADVDQLEKDRMLAERIFRDLVTMPLGTRTNVLELAMAYGVDETGKFGISLLDVNDLLFELVRKDGRFILDNSHSAGYVKGMTYERDFTLLRNNMGRYDKIAEDFAISHGKYGAVFESYYDGSAVYNEILDEYWESSCGVIVVEKRGTVSYMTQKELFDYLEELERISDDGDYYPRGRFIYDSMEIREELGTATDYEREVVSACMDCGDEKLVNENSLFRALEEAEFLGMRVAIVPNPEYQIGEDKEGQNDVMGYHPEVVTMEEYERLFF